MSSFLESVLPFALILVVLVVIHELGHFVTAKIFGVKVLEFGIGYPPFMGGPFRTLDAMGAKAAVEALEHLASACGPRFAPAQILTDQARDGGRFHPRS